MGQKIRSKMDVGHFYDTKLQKVHYQFGKDNVIFKG